MPRESSRWRITLAEFDGTRLIRVRFLNITTCTFRVRCELRRVSVFMKCAWIRISRRSYATVLRGKIPGSTKHLLQPIPSYILLGWHIAWRHGKMECSLEGYMA